MKTIKIFSFLIFISVISPNLSSQNTHGKDCPKDNEKIKSEKVSFITEKVGFTVKEAQDFWPVYNELDEKMSKLFTEERSISKELHVNLSTLTDKQFIEKTDRLIDLKVEKAKLEKEYYEKYKSLLPAKKVALFYQADKDFRKHLIKKYNDKPCVE